MPDASPVHGEERVDVRSVEADVQEPRSEYERRLTIKKAEEARWERLDRTFSNGRLLVFGIGVIIAWLILGSAKLAGWWIIAPIVAFAVLARRHDAVIRNKQRATRAANFYLQGLRRIDDEWRGTGNSGTRYVDSKHPYAGDLDIFGVGSLFELLCTARTRAGEATLAEWLASPADSATVRARQKAVQELRSQLDLREDLAVLGERLRADVDVNALAVWGAKPALLATKQIRMTGIALVAVSLLALPIGWEAGYKYIPFLIMAVVEAIFVMRVQAQVREVVTAVDRLSKDLEILSLLLSRLEAANFETPLLKKLHSVFETEGAPPSARIARLERYIELLEVPHSPLLKILNIVLLWTTQCAGAIETWREESGAQIAGWLETVGELEALSALASYAYEHPVDVFPEICDSEVDFAAVGLGHPLLPQAKAVRNDVCISEEIRLIIVSGSNMSGKSTLLRAIGVNVVLGLAGAPVRATQLRLSPFQLGASIHINDSLQEGISRFYAEILRLRQIVDMAGGKPPLLFLLDEILHGTNSHDRRSGAAAVIRTLIVRKAVGLVTTHDLALAAIADDAALHAINVHFEDQLVEGKMQFDYNLRPGVVTRSNAIELMRAIGLEV